MDELTLVYHLLELYKIVKRDGILQLEDFNTSSNKWYDNSVYSFCIQAVLNNIEISKISSYLEIGRSRLDIIIIKGFEFIQNPNQSLEEIALYLGAMMEQPRFNYDLLNFPIK